MPKLKYPKKVRRKMWGGEYREVDRQVLVWLDRRKKRPRKLKEIKVQAKYKTKRTLKRKQPIIVEDAPTIDFFGDGAPTPLATQQSRLEDLFPAFKKRFKK